MKLRWTNKRPTHSAYWWWLSGPMPMVIAVNREGRLSIFGDRGKGQLITQVGGLWAGPLLPDMDMNFTQPETTGYFWTELHVGAPPVIVSVFIDKENPMVSVLGMPEPMPLGEMTGRWSERLDPPTEVDTSGQIVKPIT